MARKAEAIAVVVGIQSAETVVNPEVLAATIVANTDDGVALSAGEALGVSFRDDSFDFDLERIEEEGQLVTGTLSVGAGTFNRIDAALTFDTTVKGSGVVTPSMSGDYNLAEATEALYAASGLVRGAETSSDTTYNLTEPSFISIKIWRGDQSWTLVDCRNDPTYNFTPSEVLPLTHVISSGLVIHNPTDTFPVSIDYGLQLSLKAPILRVAESVLGAEVADWTTLTLAMGNNFTEFPAANSLTGIVSELEKRVVAVNGNFFVDTAGDEDQYFQNLQLEVPPVDNLDFVLGEAGATGAANAIHFTVANLALTVNSVEQLASRILWNLQGNATTTVGNDEFVLVSE